MNCVFPFLWVWAQPSRHFATVKLAHVQLHGESCELTVTDVARLLICTSSDLKQGYTVLDNRNGKYEMANLVSLTSSMICGIQHVCNQGSDSLFNDMQFNANLDCVLRSICFAQDASFQAGHAHAFQLCVVYTRNAGRKQQSTEVVHDLPTLSQSHKEEISGRSSFSTRTSKFNVSIQVNLCSMTLQYSWHCSIDRTVVQLL